MSLGWSEGKARRIRNLAGIRTEVVKRKHRYKKAKAEIPAPHNLTKTLTRYKDPEKPWQGLDFSGMARPSARVWAQDFTYIKTRLGMVYVAAILKLSSREIIGWSIGTNHSAELTCQALLDALSRHTPPAILHSDRGSEYMSFGFGQLCEAAGIKMSASSPGSPWQNGFCERVMNTLKNEGESLYKAGGVAEIAEIIARRIYYYNHERIHTKLGMPPAVYAEKNGLNEAYKVSGKNGA